MSADNLATTTIILKGSDGLEHARGQEPIATIMDYPLVERNRHIYQFKGKVSGQNAYIFEEVYPPAVITKW